MEYQKKHKISVYLTEEQIRQRTAEIGKSITDKFQGESVYLICVLKGAVFFAAELAKQIELPMTLDFMSVSSYGSATKSSGKPCIRKDLDCPVEGENLIVVEDILDSGHTLSCLLALLRERNPKTLTVCTLLDKPDRREVTDITVDYTGFVVPDKFIVGYGLDFDQRYRNLPYIGFLEDADENKGELH